MSFVFTDAIHRTVNRPASRSAPTRESYLAVKTNDKKREREEKKKVLFMGQRSASRPGCPSDCAGLHLLLLKSPATVATPPVAARVGGKKALMGRFLGRGCNVQHIERAVLTAAVAICGRATPLIGARERGKRRRRRCRGSAFRRNREGELGRRNGRKREG